MENSPNVFVCGKNYRNWMDRDDIFTFKAAQSFYSAFSPNRFPLVVSMFFGVRIRNRILHSGLGGHFMSINLILTGKFWIDAGNMKCKHIVFRKNKSFTQSFINTT